MTRTDLVRAATRDIHPLELWWAGLRVKVGDRSRRPTKLWLAKQLKISSGHLSSIFSGDFAPSDDLLLRMLIVANDAVTAEQIIQFHQRHPPVWKVKARHSHTPAGQRRIAKARERAAAGGRRLDDTDRRSAAVG